ncbi:fungal specific transcription factor domain-containing protein [Aspergillus affinis]|uniref:fungal specific transcription factor domain-containing protein n=1 Tax=Aspergillus affinis TaxID=1070780 RepID=UPI0022FE2BE6|nr:uncharacterized protein KD926_008493 [Aspergillus affinis]KAI9040170.1 hypothetical protein KD926_008493 [Aspergillus affinis]
MTSEEAQECFYMNKDTALMGYSHLVEQSLARAAFLLDDEFSTLQALVLFLTINRLSGKPSVAWKLAGLAKRSGVFRKSDLTIYEREMRARLWWNLWYLDHRAVKDLGEEDASDKETFPELPLNIDDADLDPHATKSPTPREGWTEVAFALVRFEIAMTRCQLHDQLDLNQKERLIQACETRIHDRYLRHNNDTEPIQWLTQHVAHVLIMEMWFELYSADTVPIDSWSQHVQDRLYLLAIDIVDISARLKTEPQSQKWSWLLTGYQQYRPLAFLLNELCYRQECEAVHHAWKVVEDAVTRWPDQVRASVSGKVLAGLRQRARRVQLQITQRQHLVDI